MSRTMWLRVRPCVVDGALLACLIGASMWTYLADTRQVMAFPDFYAHLHPTLAFLSAALKAGDQPLWTPHILLGIPQGISSEYGLAHPLMRWLLEHGDHLTAYWWSMACHRWAAGVCWYLYARTIGLTRLAALLSGMVYLFAYFSVRLHGYPCAYQMWFLAPLLLMMVERVRGRSWWLWTAGGACGVGLAVLGGQPDLVVYSILLACAYQLCRQGVAATTALAAAVMVGAGLGAIVLLPMWRHMAVTLRDTPLMQATDALHPLELLASPFTVDLEIRPWLPRHEAYLGFVPLLLAGIAACYRRQEWRVRFFLIAALTGALLALGPATPVFRLWHALPVVQWFRDAYRCYFVSVAAIAVLAGMGVDALTQLTREQWRRISRVAWWVSIVAVCVFMLAHGVLHLGGEHLRAWGYHYVATHIHGQAGRWHDLAYYQQGVDALLAAWQDAVRLQHPKMWLPLASAVLGAWCLSWSARRAHSHTACRLFLFGLVLGTALCLLPSFAPTIRLTEHGNVPPMLRVFEQERAPFRLSAFKSRDASWALMPASGYLAEAESGVLDFRLNHAMLSANINLAYDVAAPDGTEGLISARQARWVALWGSEPVEFAAFETGSHLSAAAQNQRLLDRLHLLSLSNVKYLVTARTLDDPRLQLVEDHPFVFQDQRLTIRLYENRTVLPRAYLVDAARHARDGEEALTLLLDASRDWRREVVLEELPPAIGGRSLTAARSRVEWVRYQPTRLALRVTSDGEGFLVLSEAWLPGWTATVDGQPAPIYQANYVMRAIPVTAGEHAVELSYEPPGYRLGRRISVATGGVILIGLSVGLVQWSRG